MATLPAAPDFEQALGDLQAHLPERWRTTDPTSQIYLLLQALGETIDELAELWEQPHLDQALLTASAVGLQRNFAFAWGLTQEQLPAVLTQLVAYIEARTQEDGSLLGMVNTLTSLVDAPVNLQGGPIATFPAGGGGLVFPDPAANLIFAPSIAPGSTAVVYGITLPATFGQQPLGIGLYEFTPGNGPSLGIGLVFPASGGLTFPAYPQSLPSDNVVVQDGSTAIGAGPGLSFASNQFIQISRNFSGYRMTVMVQSWLAFDRPAFARAVARFQPADWLPTLILEISSY